MNDARTTRLLRVLSLILLLAALVSLGLSMARITFSPGLLAELNALPGLGSLPQACVTGGIAAYSGLTLVWGGAPAVNAACLSQVQDSGQANLGIQPPALAAALLILGAVLITVRAPRRHGLMTAGLCLVAAVLLLVDALRLGGVFASHFGRGGSAVVSEPDLGLWVVDGLLLVVASAPLAAAAAGWVERALAPAEELEPR